MDVEAQSIDNYPSDDGTEQSNFQPSVAVVIGILSVMFALTFVLLVYAKFCHRRGSVHLEGRRIGTSSRFSGIDKKVIEALPFFRFSTLKGSKEGLECAVCLSKFEDIEILRFLPKCKHAFHINCIDHWLEKHSSCPLCRHRVTSEDLTFIAYTNSMRVLWDSQPNSNIELFVQREEDHRGGSSRFSLGSSFRKIENKEEEMLIQQEEAAGKLEVLHKHKHKILASDFVFKNRWSNGGDGDEEIVREQSQQHHEQKHHHHHTTTTSAASNLPTHASSSMSGGEKRSMSEITALSRFGNWGTKNRTKEPSLLDNNVKEERMRRLWLPIARRTVQWYANRERRSQQPQHSTNV
ncbi:hypothetical protein M0R45_003391 [Rubus argutus]|uniref:RING-type E3 ubiquitin transferase n=1 Tax=Rubus argutus TaxID=59490 RepID=A0AAW1YHP2_RUBAR